MGLFSKELQILDKNTVQYMIDQMQDTIDEQKNTIGEQQSIIQEQQTLLQIFWGWAGRQRLPDCRECRHWPN